MTLNMHPYTHTPTNYRLYAAGAPTTAPSLNVAPIMVPLMLLHHLAAGGSTSSCDPRSLAAAKASGCPHPRWQNEVASALKRDAEMVFVNAGANKGFNVVDFLQRYRKKDPATPTAKQWLEELIRFRPDLNSACGVCHACKEKSSRKHAFHVARNHCASRAIGPKTPWKCVVVPSRVCGCVWEESAGVCGEGADTGITRAEEQGRDLSRATDTATALRAASTA